jgi:phospholipid/cholesterol/gamma-HCH transport system substrate-binding protein
MRRKIDIEIKAGIFLFASALLMMFTILLMGGGKSLFEKSYELYVVIPDAGGLAKGAAVRSGGLKIGRVDNLEFSSDYTSVKVTMVINKSFEQRVREDSIVKMQTQGVLGDKFLEIAGGTPGTAHAKENSTISAEPAKDLTAVLADGSSAVQLLKENLANLKVITGSMARNNQMDHIMKDLSEMTANMKDFSKQMKSGSAIAELNQTLKNLRSVTEKMKNGEGTIGALLSDASLYEDLKHLIGGANRNNVLKFFVRQAVKSSDDAAVKAEKPEEKKLGKEPASQGPPVPAVPKK